jgi:flavin-binding protein dodecin
VAARSACVPGGRSSAAEQPAMKDPVYKLIELTGTSTTSIEDAVDKAVKRAHKTIKNLCWFQLIETRGNISKGKVDHWQVTLKIGFTVVD